MYAKTITILLLICSAHLFARATNGVLGYSGLIVTPTAEILADGQLSVSIGRIPRLYADRYRPYDRTAFVAAMGFLPFLEATFGFVRPDNFQGGVGDRTMTIRAQLLPEQNNTPAIAIGLHDFFAIEQLELEPVAAQHFAALYVVMTKDLLASSRSSLALTLGYGFSWLPANDSYLQGFFGGMSYSPIEQLELLVEHDARYVNAGIRFNFFSHLHYTLSFWQMQHLMHQMSYSIFL